MRCRDNTLWDYPSLLQNPTNIDCIAFCDIVFNMVAWWLIVDELPAQG